MSDAALAALSISPAFSALPEEVLSQFASIALLETYAPNQTVFQKGDPGDAFYVISRGEAEVEVDDPDGAGMPTVLREGDFFGEMAIIWNQPRVATVRASFEELELIKMPRDPLVALLRHNRDLVDVLVQVGMLRNEENLERFLTEG